MREVRRAAETLMGAADRPWQVGQCSVYDLPELVDAISAAVRGALDVLVGAGQWEVAANWGFPTRSAGMAGPYWHIDGDWFTHHVTSCEQVVTPIFLWGDVTSADSPTLLAVGSQAAVARLLASHEPNGVAGRDIARLAKRLTW